MQNKSKLAIKSDVRICGDGMIILTVNEKEYSLSVIHAKILSSKLTHSIKQSQDIAGEQQLPLYVFDQLKREFESKDKWLEELLSGKLTEKEDAKNSS